MLWFRSFAILLIIKSFAKISISDFIHLPYRNDTDSVRKFNYIENILADPIKSFTYIKLILRTEHWQKDTENMYVRWLLQQSACPLKIEPYNDEHCNLFNLKYNEEYYATVIDINLLYFVFQRNHELQKAMMSFFILVDDDNNLNWKKLHEIMQLMWNKKFFQNFILSSKGIFIYDPFEYDANGSSYGQIKAYTEYRSDRKLSHTFFNNMRGYPLRVAIFKSVYSRPIIDKSTGRITLVEGVDGKVALTLQERLNFTLNLLPPNPHKFGDRSTNGSYNGVIGDIINSEIDLCLTGFFVKDYMAPEISFTVVAYDDDLCIYVPKAKRIPPALLPLFAVKVDLWIAFFFIAFASSITWCLIRWVNICLKIKAFAKLRVDKSLVSQFLQIFIDTLVVWARVNINRHPPFYSERIFVASLCLVSIIFGALFESSLDSTFIEPMYFEDINTLKQLDESGLKIAYKYKSMADDLFFSDSSSLFNNLNKKLTFKTNFSTDIAQDVAENRNKAGITRKSVIVLELLHLSRSEKIWMIPECPKRYAVSYVMPKQSPLKETVNYWISRIQSSGFVKKWADDMRTKVEINILTKYKSEQANRAQKALNMLDLQLSFYVLIFGNALAGLIFIFEMFMSSRVQCIT